MVCNVTEHLLQSKNSNNRNQILFKRNFISKYSNDESEDISVIVKSNLNKNLFTITADKDDFKLELEIK